jgi:hypothetical protein
MPLAQYLRTSLSYSKENILKIEKICTKEVPRILSQNKLICGTHNKFLIQISNRNTFEG